MASVTDTHQVIAGGGILPHVNLQAVVQGARQLHAAAGGFFNLPHGAGAQLFAQPVAAQGGVPGRVEPQRGGPPERKRDSVGQERERREEQREREFGELARLEVDRAEAAALQAAEAVLAAGTRAGERYAQLPLVQDYREEMDSWYGEFVNTGGTDGSLVKSAML